MPEEGQWFVDETTTPAEVPMAVWELIAAGPSQIPLCHSVSALFLSLPILSRLYDTFSPISTTTDLQGLQLNL